MTQFGQLRSFHASPGKIYSVGENLKRFGNLVFGPVNECPVHVDDVRSSFFRYGYRAVGERRFSFYPLKNYKFRLVAVLASERTASN